MKIIEESRFTCKTKIRPVTPPHPVLFFSSRDGVIFEDYNIISNIDKLGPFSCCQSILTADSSVFVINVQSKNTYTGRTQYFWLIWKTQIVLTSNKYITSIIKQILRDGIFWCATYMGVDWVNTCFCVNTSVGLSFGTRVLCSVNIKNSVKLTDFF